MAGKMRWGKKADPYSDRAGHDWSRVTVILGSTSDFWNPFLDSDELAYRYASQLQRMLENEFPGIEVQLTDDPDQVGVYAYDSAMRDYIDRWIDENGRLARRS